MPNQPQASAGPALPVINDCWNKIGVWGDGSCPELARHVHCRHCPVYSAAAAELLNGELPAGYLAEWTAHFAREKPVVERDTQSAVIFRVGTEWFALSVTMFKEISELKAIHSLPHRRTDIVLGLANIRGELLVCVSLAKVLNLEQPPESNPAAHPFLLVISHEGTRLVFPVDAVGGLQHFSLQTVQKVPATVAGAMATYVTGILPWQGKSVGCLDGPLLYYTLNKSLA